MTRGVRPPRRECAKDADPMSARLDRPADLPAAPVERWLAPVHRFLQVESASGIVLLTCTLVALILANSPLADWYAALWETEVSLSIGGFDLSGSIGHLV